MLCRISKRGLYDTWTPVKLADLFSQMAPDLVGQLNAAGKLPFMPRAALPVPVVAQAPTNATRLREALKIYVTLYLEELGQTLMAEHADGIEREIDQIQHLADTASDQRSAFLVIERALNVATGLMVNPNRNLEFREVARAKAGVSLFPSLARNEPNTPSAAIIEGEEDAPRVLDVEVVAIYW